MRLIALLSGGKDSVLSMLLCAAHGHDVVCAANLHPPQPEGDPGDVAEADELDSYCFQTVGHRSLQTMCDALGLPLHRATIERGQSRNQELVYDTGRAEQDEVEVMFELLHGIRDQHKDDPAGPIGGVCSGAILSDYQRLRVEHVCGRLGLLSYSYLWQRPAAEVLSLVARLRVEAMLIKVASMGLDPRRHLARSLVALTPYFATLAPHVHGAGEGGEFETFVLACPFKARSERLDWRGAPAVVVTDDNPMAPVGMLRFDVQAQPKTDADAAADAAVWHDLVLPPPMLRRQLGLGIVASAADTAEEVEVQVDEATATMFPTHAALQAVSGDLAEGAVFETVVLHPRPDHDATVVPSTAIPGAPRLAILRNATGPATATTSADQVRAIFGGLTEAQRRAVYYTMVFLPTMADFLAINKVYVEFFGVSPPARAVVECAHLDRIVVDVYMTHDPSDEAGCAHPVASVPADTSSSSDTDEEPEPAPRCDTRRRDVLHVQSISNWAAACIGPYAQANRVLPDRVMFTAGAIGLDPGTMVPTGTKGATFDDAAVAARTTEAHSVQQATLYAQFATTFRNLQAVLAKMGTPVAAVTHLVAFITDPAAAEALPRLWRWATGCALPPRTRAVVVTGMPRNVVVELVAVDWQGFDGASCPLWTRDFGDGSQ